MAKISKNPFVSYIITLVENKNMFQVNENGAQNGY